MPEFGGKTYGYDVKGLKQLEKDKASARATRREQRARPGTITTTERKTIESGTLPTSEQQMPTRYPQFDAQANPTEMGAVAAQLSGSVRDRALCRGSIWKTLSRCWQVVPVVPSRENRDRNLDHYG